MTAPVEQAFAAVLQAAFDSIPLVAVARGATESADLGNSKPIVIVEASVPHDVGSLYDGILKITISTPVKVAPFDAASHSALVQAAKDVVAWEDGDTDAATKTTAIDAALSAASSRFESRGFFFQGGEDRRDAETLQTELSVTWGLEIVPP